jgi:hypothetical protein
VALELENGGDLMRRSLRRAIAGTATLAVTMIVAPLTSVPQATAATGDQLRGGCGFVAVNVPGLTNGQNEGVIFVAAYSQASNGTPSGATVSCWIDVNGNEQPGTRITVAGSGPIVGQEQIMFGANETDSVTECEEVTFAASSTVDCPAATEVTIPPQSARDTIASTVIPIICPVLVSLGPQNVFGVLTIATDGDVSAGGGVLNNPIIDCPPYVVGGSNGIIDDVVVWMYVPEQVLG